MPYVNQEWSTLIYIQHHLCMSTYLPYQGSCECCRIESQYSKVLIKRAESELGKLKCCIISNTKSINCRFRTWKKACRRWDLADLRLGDIFWKAQVRHTFRVPGPISQDKKTEIWLFLSRRFSKNRPRIFSPTSNIEGISRSTSNIVCLNLTIFWKSSG